MLLGNDMDLELLHRVVVKKKDVAPTSTSTMKLDSQEAKEWIDPAAKATTFIISKLKIHLIRKRKRYPIKTYR